MTNCYIGAVSEGWVTESRRPYRITSSSYAPRLASTSASTRHLSPPPSKIRRTSGPEMALATSLWPMSALNQMLTYQERIASATERSADAQTRTANALNEICKMVVSGSSGEEVEEDHNEN